MRNSKFVQHGSEIKEVLLRLEKEKEDFFVEGFDILDRLKAETSGFRMLKKIDN